MSLRLFKKKGFLYCVFIDDCIEGHIKLLFTDDTKKQLEWEYISIPVTLHEIEGGPALKCAEINEMPQEKFILTKQ